MDYSDLCENILKIDSKIRFAGVLGKNGALIGEGFSKNSQKLLSPDEAKMSYHYASQRWDSRKNLEYKIGSEKYSITEYDKVKQISIPLDGNNLILISTEPDTDHNDVLIQALDLIKNRSD